VERPGAQQGLTSAAERPLPKALEGMARSAFRLRALEPVPGWRFGQWDRGDPRAWLRRAIWQLAQSRHYDGPVTTDWYLGLKFNHHLRGDISRCTYVDGRYEPNEMFAVARLLAPGMCVVDAGANEGLFTILAARIVGESGTVHAFEPSPREQSRLQANLAVNRLSNVKVHRTALGRAPGKSTLRVAEASHPGHNALGGFMYAGTVLEESVEVDIVTLDQAVRGEKLTRLDLLKIDVEGSEVDVLQGADEVLRTLRPVVLAEAQDESLRRMGSNVGELLKLLRAHDYEVKVFGESGHAETLVDDRATGLNVLCLPR
jgi:FkbM family methyltransferase